MKMLIQTQLSNYDTNGKFILEADSGWQMVLGRVRVMLELLPESEFHIIGPHPDQLVTSPKSVNPDIFSDRRVKYRGIFIQPNALATRYNFDLPHYANVLGLSKVDGPVFDWVYINDPMHLRNFKALFYLYANYTPKFAVHSHFIDNPSCPKFPTEASLWLGQIEASVRADINFWQCQSALDIYKEEVNRFCKEEVVEAVMKKSYPWDDGYSYKEMYSSDALRTRFTYAEFAQKVQDKLIIFVPNRVGGRGRSSDYTNVGKFLFDILPQLRKRRQDFVVIAGNPSQKFSNKELEDELGPYGFINLVPNAFTRDEYRFVASFADIAVGLYDQDSYGGTAARELLDRGAFPLWLDNYEYARLARQAQFAQFLAKPDFSDIVDAADKLMSFIVQADNDVYTDAVKRLQTIIRARCSYESTTPEALKLMGLLP